MASSGRAWVGILALALVVGCDESPETDGGAGADGGDLVDAGPGDASSPVDARSVDAGPPSVAMRPAAPAFDTCPPGWSAIEVEGLAACDPWPSTGIAGCGEGEAHFPGEAACRAVGAACGDEYASELPASGVLFVAPLGPGVGSGSRSDPFGTIAQALAVAGAGDTIALSRGRFVQDQIDLPSDVRLVGACPAETILESAALESDFGVVSVFASTGGAVEGVAIEGRRPGVFVGAGGEVTLRGVIVRDVEGFGVIAQEGGAVVAEDLLIRDVSLYDSFSDGDGAVARLGGSLSIARGVIERTIVHGVLADHPGSTVTLTDVAIRDIAEDPFFGARGMGVFVREATATLARVAIDRVSEAAVGSLLGGVVDATDVVARDIAQNSGTLTNFGAGFYARSGARVTASRVLVDRASHAGIFVHEPSSSIALTDAIVHATRLVAEPELNRWGMGVVVDIDGSATLTRTAVLGNTFLGVFARTASVTLDDVIVNDTLAVADGGDRIYGRGLEIHDGAQVTLHRASFAGNRDVSISLTDPSSLLVAEDLTVVDTESTELGRFGYGIQLVEGSRVELTRATLRGNRGMGILAGTADFTATQIEITGGRPMGCVDLGSCSAIAYDVGVLDGATGRVAQFTFDGAPTAALQLGGTGEADLEDGVVSSTDIAFNVQNGGFDDSRLRAGVTFVGVATELDTSSLPILEIPPFGI